MCVRCSCAAARVTTMAAVYNVRAALAKEKFYIRYYNINGNLTNLSLTRVIHPFTWTIPLAINNNPIRKEQSIETTRFYY